MGVPIGLKKVFHADRTGKLRTSEVSQYNNCSALVSLNRPRVAQNWHYQSQKQQRSQK